MRQSAAGVKKQLGRASPVASVVPPVEDEVDERAAPAEVDPGSSAAACAFSASQLLACGLHAHSCYLHVIHANSLTRSRELWETRSKALDEICKIYSVHTFAPLPTFAPFRHPNFSRTPSKCFLLIFLVFVFF